MSVVGEKMTKGKNKIVESEEVKTQRSGAKIFTKRTVKTFAPRGQEKSTPWGVTLKPVPRKSISEEITKIDSEKVEASKYEILKGSSPEKSKLIKSKLVKLDTVTGNDIKITETVQIKVSL